MSPSMGSVVELELRAELAALRRRLEELEARLETLDASFVRHQDGNEGALDRIDQHLRSLERRLDEHADAHWRAR
jgi:chromosome segregation ATPase